MLSYSLEPSAIFQDRQIYIPALSIWSSFGIRSKVIPITLCNLRCSRGLPGARLLGLLDGIMRVWRACGQVERLSPWARRRTLPPPWGILGTYIVLKHSPRVFQTRLFALLKWRRLAVRPHSLCEAKKPQDNHVVVFENYT